MLEGCVLRFHVPTCREYLTSPVGLSPQLLVQTLQHMAMHSAIQKKHMHTSGKFHFRLHWGEANTNHFLHRVSSCVIMQSTQLYTVPTENPTLQWMWRIASGNSEFASVCYVISGNTPTVAQLKLKWTEDYCNPAIQLKRPQSRRIYKPGWNVPQCNAGVSYNWLHWLIPHSLSL